MEQIEFINGRPIGLSDEAWDKVHETIARVLIRLENEQAEKERAKKAGDTFGDTF